VCYICPLGCHHVLACLYTHTQAKEHCNGIELDGRRIRVDYSITKRPHTPTPGVYMGKPTHPSSGSQDRYHDDDYDRGYDRRSYDRGGYGEWEGAWEGNMFMLVTNLVFLTLPYFPPYSFLSFLALHSPPSPFTPLLLPSLPSSLHSPFLPSFPFPFTPLPLLSPFLFLPPILIGRSSYYY